MACINVNSPLLLDNPQDFKRKLEVYTNDSDFILPGQDAKIIVKNEAGEEVVLINSIKVLAIRWEVSFSNKKAGFVTFALSKENEDLLKENSDIAIRKL